MLLLLFVFPVAGCGRATDQQGSAPAETASPRMRGQRPNHPPKPIDDGNRYTAESGKVRPPENVAWDRGPASIGTLSITAPVHGSVSEDSGLLLGSPVPPLVDLPLVAGASPASFRDGRLLLVHFWEPWNLLSRQSVLLLTRLQNEFPDSIHVLHIAAADARTVTEFLDETALSTEKPRREHLDGTFLADTQRQMMRTWKVSSGAAALPVVYLTDAAGILQWSGPALRSERPVKALVSGTWNVESAALAAGTLQEIERGILQNTARDLTGKARQLMEVAPDDPEGGIVLLDLLLASEKYGELKDVAQRAFEACGNDVDALNSLAWMLVAASESPRVPLETALQAANKAVQLSGRRTDTLETLARVYFRRRSFREAAAIQREAVAGTAAEKRRLPAAILREYEQAGR